MCFRFATQLLTDLVYFVTEHDTGREDVLNISVQNPNRDRQKLMREQYILKEVTFLFTALSYTLIANAFFNKLLDKILPLKYLKKFYHLNTLSPDKSVLVLVFKSKAL